MMIEHLKNGCFLSGPAGRLPVREDDEITRRVAMLYDGQCQGLTVVRAARKYGYSRQRYYQLLRLYKQGGARALAKGRTGPRSNYRRTDEVVRQIIRYRFLDPDSSPEVIAQKLRQCGYPISASSVKRAIAEFGLQKKTAPLPSQKRSR